MHSPATRALLPALIAPVFCAATFALLNAPLSWPVLIVAAAGTYLVYVLDRTWWAGPEDSTKSTRWSHPETAGACISAFALGAMAPFLQLQTILLGSALAILGFVYAVPVFGYRLKEVGLAKPVIVGLGWAIGAVIIPAAEIADARPVTLLLLLAYRLLYVLPNTLGADLADVQGDVRVYLGTPGTQWPRPHVLRSARLAVGGAVTIAVILSLTSVPGPLIVLDAVGLIPLLVLQQRQLEDRRRAWLLDLAMLWPAVTSLAYHA
jgi:hypothetical protein